MINLYNMDCMEGMKDYPDNHFELAIVDPPYGIGESCGKNIKRTGGLAQAKDYGYKEWDTSSPNIIYFSQLERVSKQQIIWGANHFIEQFPLKMANSSCWIVWDKVNYGNDFADCELAHTSFKSAVRQFTFQWNGMLQDDMKNKEFRIHPTQKPVKLYEWLLTNYAKEGDKILDTHLGSGSIALACHNMGFSLDGYEIDEDYFKSAKARLEEHQKQQQLFIG